MNIQHHVGKKIASITLGSLDDNLHIWFSDGTGVKISDDDYQCCEQRYITTDDDLTSYVGDTLLGTEVKGCSDLDTQEGYHEIQFLEIKTDKGCITFTTHNEHNGYYSGFNIRTKDLP